MRTVKPIHYLQYDTRWGSIMFSNHSDPKQTIKSSGCGAASFAMVLATFLNQDPKITPPDVAKVILSNGYRTYNNGVDWGFFPFAAKHYGLFFKQTNSTDEAIEALKNRALVVASMGPGYFTTVGHYILLWGLDESGDQAGQILVNDPNSTVRVKASFDLFKKECAQYFIFYEPEQMKKGNEKEENEKEGNRKEENEKEGVEKTMPESWQVDILKKAQEAGLITSAEEHDPLQEIGELPLWFLMATMTNFLVAVKQVKGR